VKLVSSKDQLKNTKNSTDSTYFRIINLIKPMINLYRPSLVSSLYFYSAWSQFHQTFSPSEKTPAHGIWQKIRRLISPTIYTKTVQPNLSNLWPKIRQICAPFAKMPFTKKKRRILRAKNSCANVDEIDPSTPLTYSTFTFFFVDTSGLVVVKSFLKFNTKV
jgi:hypothetical protein